MNCGPITLMLHEPLGWVLGKFYLKKLFTIMALRYSHAIEFTQLLKFLTYVLVVF